MERSLRRCAATAAGLVRSRRWMGMVTRHWERKKFYRHVTVYKEDSERGWFGVKLDHRNLRTPFKQLFMVPTEGLALAVAQEWQSQSELVQPSLMHITALCNTVLDKTPESREDVIGHLLGYMTSDTLCFRAPEPEDLVSLQTKEWDPVVNWFSKRFDCKVVPSDSFAIPPSGIIFGPSTAPSGTPETPGGPTAPSSNPAGDTSAVTEFMEALNRWAFAGFEHSVDSSKSLILSCAMFEGHISSEEACHLARLETKYQVSKWGEVDWSHTVEESDLRARLAAALVLKELT